MKTISDSSHLASVVPDEILDWAEEMGRRGLYDPNTARLFRTALRSLLSVLAEGEPRDPTALISNLELIADRWGRGNKANPATIRTYRQRAAALLDDFVTYMQNPASFKGRGGGTSKKSMKKERPATPSPVDSDQTDAAPRSSSMNTFRLPNGEVFRYALPEVGITVEDVRRIAYHLLTAASDFDPMKTGSGFPPVSQSLKDSSADLQ